MAYYREEETRNLIENFARWAGDGEGIRCAMSTLGVLLSELMRKPGPLIPTLGIEAGRTGEALEAMEPKHARALVLYHADGRVADSKARELGVSRRTFYSLVEYAHPLFWDAIDTVSLAHRQRETITAKARQHHEAARSTGPSTLTRPSADMPRLVKRRRVVRRSK